MQGFQSIKANAEKNSCLGLSPISISAYTSVLFSYLLFRFMLSIMKHCALHGYLLFLSSNESIIPTAKQPIPIQQAPQVRFQVPQVQPRNSQAHRAVHAAVSIQQGVVRFTVFRPHSRHPAAVQPVSSSAFNRYGLRFAAWDNQRQSEIPVIPSASRTQLRPVPASHALPGGQSAKARFTLRIQNPPRRRVCTG